MALAVTQAAGTTARRFAGRRVAARALAAALCAAASALALAPAALAKTYTDVPKAFWARAQITWVTNQGPSGNAVLDDYKGGLFKPNQAVTRAQLARALVIASGHQGDQFSDALPPDVKASDPNASYVRIALHLGYMAPFTDGFRPSAAVLAWQADRAVVRMIKTLHADADWKVLPALNPAGWQPNDGWKTGAPRYFASEVVARYLGLRFNHDAAQDKQEVSPGERIGRDEVAYMIYTALHLSSWRIGGLANFDSVVLPTLTGRQKKIVAFAFKYIGYPYVWAGEYPAKDSPYGAQAHGGFDCSGFDWWVMKIHFGYTINERVAADMARAAKPRITRAKLVPGDLIFFGPNGPKSTAASIYHAALYLGNGWFIHSTGSLDGVGLSSITRDSYYKAAFAWGRRVLKSGEFKPAAVALAPVLPAPAAPAAPPPVTPPPATPSPQVTTLP
jgi:hypothetical protein